MIPVRKQTSNPDSFKAFVRESSSRPLTPAISFDTLVFSSISCAPIIEILKASSADAPDMKRVI